MAKATGPRKDLGVRYTCYSCGAKFYDLHRPVPTCPKCGADQREDPALKAPKPAPERPARKKAAAKPVRPRREEEEEELETQPASDHDELGLDDLDEEESNEDDLEEDLGDEEESD